MNSFRFLFASSQLHPHLNSGIMSSTPKPTQLKGMLVGNDKFKILEKIGSGGYGEVYFAQRQDQDGKVAVKVERRDSKSKSLEWEASVYQVLRNGPGIPKGIWAGMTPDRTHRLLVLELLGPSLQDLVSRLRQLNKDSVYLVGIQIMNAFQYIHSKGILHRDVKPANILTGVGRNKLKVYLSDFGISSKFRDVKTGNQIPQATGKGFVGTESFASINSHNGTTLSPRDDLESLGFSLVYLLKGRLPWTSVAAATEVERLSQIKHMKTSVLQCPEFGHFLLQARKLKYNETPDYVNIMKVLDMEYKYITGRSCMSLL